MSQLARTLLATLLTAALAGSIAIAHAEGGAAGDRRPAQADPIWCC